jgi:AcrR family transcriptional regulator
MNMSTVDKIAPGGSREPGLRERKKVQTKSKIRQVALSLFARHGYESTTMEQIAAQAEVSPSTVYRYFTAKDELLVFDDYDTVFEDQYRAQPASLCPLQALRGAIRVVFAEMTTCDVTAQHQHQVGLLANPALWPAGAQNILDAKDLLARLFAERVGRAPEDPSIQTMTGAALGSMLVVAWQWAERPDLDPLQELDATLTRLIDGIPL